MPLWRPGSSPGVGTIGMAMPVLFVFHVVTQTYAAGVCIEQSVFQGGNMGGWPSGLWQQTLNLTAVIYILVFALLYSKNPPQVRILFPPPCSIDLMPVPAV